VDRQLFPVQEAEAARQEEEEGETGRRRSTRTSRQPERLGFMPRDFRKPMKGTRKKKQALPRQDEEEEEEEEGQAHQQQGLPVMQELPPLPALQPQQAGEQVQLAGPQDGDHGEEVEPEQEQEQGQGEEEQHGGDAAPFWFPEYLYQWMITFNNEFFRFAIIMWVG
jgi:hypothetical protein